jgi:GR25 family glycosyltransferase involved in LPS biosynthesis
MLSPALKNFHDAVFVVTAPGFDERQQSAREQLGEGNFEFVYGINKASTSKHELIKQGVYDEQRAIDLDRSSKPMTLGHICCSYGHRLAYQRMIDNSIERALIFEDDLSVLPVAETEIEKIVAAVPTDAELVYWGWSGVDKRPRLGGAKQSLYKLYHSFGALKYNHTMIDNLYPAEINDYFLLAGKFFGAYAYTVTLSGARTLLEWNTPIALNGDNALMYAVLNGDIRGYVSRVKVFGEHSQGVPGFIDSQVIT